MKQNSKYVFFYTGEDVFSNFYMSKFIHKGIEFECSEQAFMYRKAEYFGGKKEASELKDSKYIWNLKDRYGNRLTKKTFPIKCKQIGRSRGIPFKEDVWEDVSYDIMKEVLYDKFSKKELKEFLLSTGDKTLVEASPKDLKWGIGVGINDNKLLNKSNWVGENLLGKALMEVREQLKNEGR